jgi:hypothetical protein
MKMNDSGRVEVVFAVSIPESSEFTLSGAPAQLFRPAFGSFFPKIGDVPQLLTL